MGRGGMEHKENMDRFVGPVLMLHVTVGSAKYAAWGPSCPSLACQPIIDSDGSHGGT